MRRARNGISLFPFSPPFLSERSGRTGKAPTGIHTSADPSRFSHYVCAKGSGGKKYKCFADKPRKFSLTRLNFPDFSWFSRFSSAYDE
ncbi:PREDICTED: uncharacterized protein LOC105457963 isoform X2 [Wasmannia auropunctata]|uniref:uncharacterized protein LOC105457963 isoform X2 n=1 Tax=Wasmannia auropunctata TaxID=64793 RepID=UPI0005EDFF74|nr:PREDICTED: uncharacterized protein LOC105457963 isoform X2 [Wasmannia auropunctata]